MRSRILTLAVSLSFSTPILASGNTSGSVGKSSGSATRSGSGFESSLDPARKKALNKRKGTSASSFDHSHGALTRVLNRSVMVKGNGQFSQVDYRNVDRKKLNDYIQNLLDRKKSDVNQWSKQEQQAYYFNLYNALTIELILKKYPVESIKDLGSGFPLFRSPWKKKFFTLFGELTYLDHIEHGLTRGNDKLLDPLVHFAFNCASIGCPALLNKAFEAATLESELQMATKNFLKDRSRNYVKGDTVFVSSIFKWYREDFEKGLRGFHSLEDFFLKYSDSLADTAAQKKLLASKKYDIEFLDYNWKLNDVAK